MSVLVSGLDPQVNKSEQVPSDDHQISVAGGRGLGPRPDICGRGYPTT